MNFINFLLLKTVSHGIGVTIPNSFCWNNGDIFLSDFYDNKSLVSIIYGWLIWDIFEKSLVPVIIEAIPNFWLIVGGSCDGWGRGGWCDQRWFRNRRWLCSRKRSPISFWSKFLTLVFHTQRSRCLTQLFARLPCLRGRQGWSGQITHRQHHNNRHWYVFGE